MARSKMAKPTTVYLTEAQKKSLAKRAKKSGSTAAQLIRDGIDAVLMAEPPKEPEAVDPVLEATTLDPVSQALATKPPLDERGVSGTVIWSGQISAEANSRLKDEAGYGTPGSTEWGEWEKLERTDHAIASALGLISAPLRDSTLEVEPAPEPEQTSAPVVPGEEAGGEEEAPADESADVLANLDEGQPPPPGVKPLAPETEESEEEADPDDPTAVLKAVTAGPTRNEVIAGFVKDCLQKWMAPGWAMLAEQIARYGLGYGFYLGEKVWATRPDSRVPGGTAWYIKKIAQRLPSSIQSNGWIEKDGDLDHVLQAGVRDGKWFYGLELPISKCLLATWQRNGNNYRGFPAFRPVWYLGKMRADLLRILGIGSGREALGILAVQTEKDVSLSPEQRSDLQDFVENAHAHEALSIQLPPGTTLNWVTSGSANKGNVLELWKALGLAMYELVQAQQTTLGTGETGSRSVGEVHDASKNAYVGGVRSWEEATLNGIGDQAGTGLVKELVDVNFGPQAEYPQAKIGLKKGEIALDVFAAAVKTFSDAGALTIGPDDENDIRERLGWAPVDPAERAAEKARKAAIATAIAGGKPQEGGPPDSTPPAGGPVPAGKAPPALSSPDPEAAQRVAQKMSEQPTQFVPRRALRPAEVNCNLAEVDAFFDSGRERFETTLRPIVEEMVRGSVSQVREAMKDGDPSELKSLKLPTKLLAKAVEVFIENARAFGYRQARQELERQGVKTLAEHPVAADAGALSAFLLDSTFEWLIPPDPEGKGRGGKTGRLNVALTDDDIAQLVEAQTKMVTERISTRLKQGVWDKAVDAVRKGQSADDAVNALLDDLEESKALRGDAELVLSRSFGMGREQVFQENADTIEALEYSAVLDRATCDPCDAVDGARFKVNSAEHLAYLTPYAKCDGRARCRCVLLPVAKQ